MANFIVNNREITFSTQIKDIAVAGDSNSTKITFTINRFFDGIDLTQKDVKINYINANNKSGDTDATLGQIEAEYFTFDWVIGSETLVGSGKIYFAVEFYEQGSDYVWQTKPATFDVEKSIVIANDAIPQNYLREIMYYNSNDNLSAYNMKSDYPTIPIVNKTIQTGVLTDVVVSGDNKSKLLTFKMDRFIDGVDISEKLITIAFINADNKSDRTSVLNFEKKATEIIFGWLLDSKVAYKNGTITFIIEILGYNEKNEFYVWKTKAAVFNVEKSIFVDSEIEPPNPSWLQSVYLEISQRADNIKYINNKLQLSADGVPIGDPIDISAATGGDMLRNQFATNAKVDQGYVDKAIIADTLTSFPTTSSIAEGSNLYFSEQRAANSFNNNFLTKRSTDLMDGNTILHDSDMTTIDTSTINKISAHNISNTSHPDIRNLLANFESGVGDINDYISLDLNNQIVKGSDEKLYVARQQSTEVEELEWGNITGNIDNQTDLKNTLSAINTNISSMSTDLQTANTNITTNSTNLYNHNISADAHTVKFNSKLDISNANEFYKNVQYNSTNGNMIFTKHDNTTTTLNLSLGSIIKGGYYDVETNDIVLILSDDSEIRIPASGLITDYDGVATLTVQVNVSEDNKISANIVGGSITKTLLSADVVASLDDLESKKHLHSNKPTIDGINQSNIDSWNSISNKVDKIAGKQLSTEDYTTSEKTKLNGIQVGAQVNTVNPADIPNKTSDLTNDSNFVNQTGLDNHNTSITSHQDIRNLIASTGGGTTNASDITSGTLSNDRLNVASTSQFGITQLTDGIASTSVATAATPNSVKQAYDLANSKEPAISILPVQKGGTGVNYLSGIPKMNGANAFSAAIAGTDYVAPTGNVASATRLQTSRTINNVPFNGTENITISDDTKLLPSNIKEGDNINLSFDGNDVTIHASQDITDFTIFSTDWIASTDYSEYPYQTDILLSGITTNSITSVYFDIDSLFRTLEYEVFANGKPLSNAIRLYCANKPDNNLSGKIIIVRRL